MFGRIKIKCNVCGNEKTYKSSIIKKGYGKFCSIRCAGINRKGKKFSEKHLKNLSLSHLGQTPWNKNRECPEISIKLKGRKLSEETKRKIGLASTGRKHSEEAKNKMSLARIGKKLSVETKRKMSEAHKEFHRRYGWKNNTREQLEEFLNKYE